MLPEVVGTVVGVGVKLEDNVGVEEMEEDQEMVKEEPKEVRVPIRDKARTKAILTPATRLSVIQIHHLSSHVFAIGPSGRVHTFAWSQEPVLGRIFMCPSQINEALTNSARTMT